LNYLCIRFDNDALSAKKRKRFIHMQLFLPWQSPNTFAFALGLRKDSEKFSEKIFRKDLAVSKKVFTFAPLSALRKQRTEPGGATLRQKQKMFFIAI